MKIAVLVKEVPDTYGDRVLDPVTGLADRSATEAVLDEIGERAIEAALSLADAAGSAEVVLVTMGPETAATSVRRGLAMGAASALHVADPALAGADLGLTAEVLAAAVRRVGPDLVISGNLSTDGVGGVLPAMLAEQLGLPQLTALSSVEVADGAVSGTRVSDAGSLRISAPLPAVVSITEALPDARFPNFKGIMAAKKKPYEFVTAAELGVDPQDAAKARSILLAVAERPAREAGVKIIDEGDAAEQLADFLVQNRLA
jgi:electron transfer flavoprotein beta subunit